MKTGSRPRPRAGSEIAGRIIREAARYGIPKKDIVIDVLAMTISSDPAGARTTLEALEGVRKDLRGMYGAWECPTFPSDCPRRPVINANFYTMAHAEGT